MVGEGGGAANFMRFFGEELIPHIDSTFRTHDYRMLVGHSFGGLFAVHALVHDPDLFDAYIAISPSLQWDEQMLVSQADAFFRDTDALAKTLYMTTGNEGMGLTGGVLKLAGVLTEHTPAGFEWDSRIMSEETHNTVVHRSTRQGLEFVFRHWGLRDVVALYDSGGFEAIHAHFAAAEIKGPMGTVALTPIAMDRFVTTGQPVEFAFVKDDADSGITLSVEIGGQAVMTAQRQD